MNINFLVEALENIQKDNDLYSDFNIDKQLDRNESDNIKLSPEFIKNKSLLRM